MTTAWSSPYSQGSVLAIRVNLILPPSTKFWLPLKWLPRCVIMVTLGYRGVTETVITSDRAKPYYVYHHIRYVKRAYTRLHYWCGYFHAAFEGDTTSSQTARKPLKVAITNTRLRRQTKMIQFTRTDPSGFSIIVFTVINDRTWILLHWVWDDIQYHDPVQKKQKDDHKMNQNLSWDNGGCISVVSMLSNRIKIEWYDKYGTVDHKIIQNTQWW